MFLSVSRMHCYRCQTESHVDCTVHFFAAAILYQDSSTQMLHNFTGSTMFCGSLVTTEQRVLRLRMEKKVSQMWRVAENILNKQSRTADKRWSPSLGERRWLTTPHRKETAERTISSEKVICSMELVYRPCFIVHLLPL
jgi:hypothetical protein